MLYLHKLASMILIFPLELQLPISSTLILLGHLLKTEELMPDYGF